VEIAKFRYENLETHPAIADTGIYLKTSGPGFFDADFYQRIVGIASSAGSLWGRLGSRSA